MSTKDSFKLRAHNAVKGKYESYMRRSLQSIALYEAHRCLEFRYSQLRPFQKKFALYATATELLKDLGFLNFFQRQEIMFRTIASKEPLAPDLAWRRMKLITREINTSILTPAYRAVIQSDENKDKSHDEICDILLQIMYDDSRESHEHSKPHHKEWEFSHNNVFTVYRMYYRGVDLDPNIFAAVPPKMVQVPLRKPPNFRLSASSIGINPTPAAAVDLSDEDRRAMLKEVKDHTELLASFVGVIPDDELVKRKRKLYAALPPVPLPATGGVPVIEEKRKRKKRRGKVAAAPHGYPTALPAVPTPGTTAMEEGDPVTTEGEPVKREPADNVAAVPMVTGPAVMEEEDSEKAEEEPIEEEPDGDDTIPASDSAAMEEEDFEKADEEAAITSV